MSNNKEQGAVNICALPFFIGIYHVDSVLGAISDIAVCIFVRGSLILWSDFCHCDPGFSSAWTALNGDAFVHLAIVFIPRKEGCLVAFIVCHCQILRCILLRRFGHKVVFPIISHTRVHSGIVGSCWRQRTILIDTRRVALTVPIIVALHIVHSIQPRADTLQGIPNLSLSHSTGKSSVIIP